MIIYKSNIVSYCLFDINPVWSTFISEGSTFFNLLAIQYEPIL